MTKEGSPDFVPVAERIAVFDNDGTLWAEQPMYFQLAFALDRVKAMAPQHPEWQTKEPFASLLKGDMKGALAGGEHGHPRDHHGHPCGNDHRGIHQTVKTWFATAKHPKTGRPYTSMVYQPMIELLAYLRASGFKTFIVSGGGVEFMRPLTERVYGIPPEQVVGSSIKTKFELRDGKPVLVRLPEVELHRRQGGKARRHPDAHRPAADRRVRQLRWGSADAPVDDRRSGSALRLDVHHTDADREWAYDRESHIGQLERALDEANAKGWTVVDMKRDWASVFAAKP